MRTLSDGPTARQKILVVSIWIFSSLFGILTCFPGKFVTETADPIAEQLQSTIKPFINPFQDKDYAKGTVKLSYANVFFKFCLSVRVDTYFKSCTGVVLRADLTGHSQFSQSADFCQKGWDGRALLGHPSKGRLCRISILFP